MNASQCRILLTGKNGQVGFELTRALALMGEVHAVGSRDCDLADFNAVKALIYSYKPHVIVNPAAYTAVDQAESELKQASGVNAVAVGVIAGAASALGSLVVHYSTDYVFDGQKPSPYIETDKTNPQSVYGRTKCTGEELLRSLHPHHLILRTSWVYGAVGNNFAKTMLRLAGERDSLKVVSDQVGAPTSAALLADATAHMIHQWQNRRADERFPYGLYHVTARGETSWHAYAQHVVAKAIEAGKNLKAGPDTILPILTSEYPTPAKRPLNSRLCVDRFEHAFNLRLPPWQDGVNHMLGQIL